MRLLLTSICVYLLAAHAQVEPEAAAGPSPDLTPLQGLAPHEPAVLTTSKKVLIIGDTPDLKKADLSLPQGFKLKTVIAITR